MTLEQLNARVKGLTSEDLKAMGLELKPKKKKTTKALYFGAFGGAPAQPEASDAGAEGGDGGGE